MERRDPGCGGLGDSEPSRNILSGACPEIPCATNGVIAGLGPNRGQPLAQVLDEKKSLEP